nr:PTS sugar transporter subunit IIB [uncultured Clostridium sp.]
MLTIRLFCMAGMSTSLLVTRMKEAAAKKGIEVDIAAHSEADMEKCLEGVDVALLGPQARYALNRAKALCEPKHVAIGVIPPVMYGRMDGEEALKLAEDMAAEK